MTRRSTTAGKKNFRIDRTNWEKIVDAYYTDFRLPGEKPIPESDRYPIPAFLHFGVCPVGLFTTESLFLFDTYVGTEGLSRVATPRDYWSLPAWLVGAMRTIGQDVQHYQDAEMKSNG